MAAQIASFRQCAQIRRAGRARLCDNPGRLFPPATAPSAFFASTNMKRLLSGLSLLVAAQLSGCGVAAAPCRVASAGLKMAPLVGHVAAAPTDACADIID
uniref:Putative lipoprotein (Modular protein) n=2 Tax=Ralstonia syzygii TaxID=28097 RepID=G3A8S5_9RALS